MTYRQLRRKLERLGCVFERQGSGSHDIQLNPANGRRTTIPRHGNRNLAIGTLDGISRDLIIARYAFDSS